MATAKPYQVWAQEQNREDQQRALSQQQAMRTAGLMAQALAEPVVERRTVHAPTHDWAASDRLAAQRAMGLEARQQQHGYQMEELDKRAELGREDDLWKIKLRQRFAPKGAGPVATLLREYVKLATDKEPGETTEARKGRLTMIHNQLSRYGKGGAQVARDISEAGFGPDRYAVKPKSEREAAELASKEGALDRRAEAANKTRLEAAQIGVQRGGGIPVDLRAAQTSVQNNKPKDKFDDTPAMQAKRAEAQAILDKYMKSGAVKVVAGKKYVPDGSGNWLSLDDDED
jgi:hypothetical protein